MAINGDPAASKEHQVFVLQRQGVFSYESRSKPGLRSERDVVVQVIATGICGSDVHYWKHGRIGNYVVEKPIVLGHESAGIVVECGSQVRSVKPGDRVAIEPGRTCGHCKHCRSGRYNLCAKVDFAATPPNDGTLATYYVVPEEYCFRLPKSVSFSEGALLEPLSVAVHVCRLAGNLQGKSTVIFGAGPIGLLCGAVSVAFGASKVVLVDIDDARLDFAKRFCASVCFKMGQQAAESNAQEICEKADLVDGADVVVDATGAQPCIECGVTCLTRGGTFIQAGLGAPKIQFPIGQACDKEIVFKGSFRYGPGDYELALELLKSERVKVKDLITGEFPFEEAEAAFELVAARGGIKTIIYGPGLRLEDCKL